MSSSNSIGPFSLNNVIVRKPIKFPDGSVQSTAYTGSSGIPTLEDVLTAGDDANSQSITGLTSLTFADTTTQSTAYTGVPTLDDVLTSGDSAGANDIDLNNNDLLNVANLQVSTINGGAYPPATTEKTYTAVYTTNQTLTMPTGCRAIDLRVIGAGGLAGSSDDQNGGDWSSGGTGSGGNSVFGTNLPVGAGVQLTLAFSLTPATGFTEVSVVGGSSLAKAFNGSNGTNANSNTPGTGASSTATPSTFDSAYGTFNTYTGTAGVNGTANNNFQDPNGGAATAGRPFGYLFTNGGIGCGQRIGSNSGAINAPAASAQGTGGVIITYYTF